MNKHLPAMFCIAVVFAYSACAAELAVKPDKADGIYSVGETIRWDISLKDAPGVTGVSYTVKKGGLSNISEGTLDIVDGAASVTAAAEEPGTLLVAVKASGGTVKLQTLGGAVIAPEMIKPSMERPADFDAFWEKKIAELIAVPANPVLDQSDSGKANVGYWKITMDNIRGTKIRGNLARPKAGDTFPALLLVQYAGVYPLPKNGAVDKAAQGWLTLNIIAHDLPVDEKPEFYKQQDAGPLKNYVAIGNEDRETSYFLRMYLSCYRAVDYLASRPDWNGKVLAVMGTSQGGLQTIVTAGFHPKVTAALALVPAGCDTTAANAQRAPGWPYWHNHINMGMGKDMAKIMETSRYYDAVNFASKITCPLLIGVGSIDTTSPAAGVTAAYNLSAGKKELVILPLADHKGANNSHKEYYNRATFWLGELLKGNSPVQ
ncbi:MAG: acetylxylan esterase [Spirochaetes bacterium]|nr:acetylxylan esterase [Spirochaetota bacterium]